MTASTASSSIIVFNILPGAESLRQESAVNTSTRTTPGMSRSGKNGSKALRRLLLIRRCIFLQQRATIYLVKLSKWRSLWSSFVLYFLRYSFRVAISSVLANTMYMRSHE